MGKIRKISLRKKVALMVLFISFLLSTAAIVAGYRVYCDDMDAKYKDIAQKLSKTEAVTIDKEMLKGLAEKTLEIYKKAWNESGEKLDVEAFNEEELARYLNQYEEVMQSESYGKIQQALTEIARVNDVPYIYVCICDLKSGKGIYLIDGSIEGELTPTGWTEDIEPDHLESFKKGDYNVSAYITNYEAYGWLCTATTSIYSDSGDIIANAYVDISMNEVMRERHEYLLHLCLVQIVITAILVVLYIWAVDNTLVKPVNRIAKAAKAYVSDREAGIIAGKTSEITKLNIWTGDEVQDLSLSLKEMEQEINRYILNLTKVTAEKERIGAELNVATQIQASMLPSIFPPFPDRKEFDIFATMNPAKEVGGDFYDFFMVDNTHIAIVMADVSGKGVPAALFMVIGKTLIKDHTLPGRDLGEVFTRVNNILCESNSEGMFITAFEGVLDLVTGEFRFVNAGHELPFICKKQGKFEAYKVRRAFVLAGMEGMTYKEQSVMLEPGDRIFQYTDGVTEATDADNQLYGMTRLETILNRKLSGSPKEILAAVKSDIDLFVGEAPQFDDITMLCLEYKARMTGSEQ